MVATNRTDGVAHDWGERFDYGRVRGRKGKNIAGGLVLKSSVSKRPAGRDKLAATVRKAPEVLVKISGGAKDMRGVKAHMDYISRNGAVEIEDHERLIHQGKEAVRSVRDDWFGTGIPYENGTKREAFNIVLSMPPGTDRLAVKTAARSFAKELFTNHQYVFASHEDEKHPHVHLTVKAMDDSGVRLNPRKADLQRWRETFAEKLGEQGIDANATPRRVRGIVKKAEKQVIRHIDQEHEQGQRAQGSYVLAAQRTEAMLEVNRGQVHVNPAHAKIVTQRKQVLRNFGTVARELAAGNQDDKQLAIDIVRFVQQMPPAQTRHAERVEALQRAKQAAKTSEQLKSKVVTRSVPAVDQTPNRERDQDIER
jgi:hypothetical protein